MNEIFLYISDIPNWPRPHMSELLRRIENVLPQRDHLVYKSRADRLNWEEVSFLYIYPYMKHRTSTKGVIIFSMPFRCACPVSWLIFIYSHVLSYFHLLCDLFLCHIHFHFRCFIIKSFIITSLFIFSPFFSLLYEYFILFQYLIQFYIFINCIFSFLYLRTRLHL